MSTNTITRLARLPQAVRGLRAAAASRSTLIAGRRSIARSSSSQVPNKLHASTRSSQRSFTTSTAARIKITGEGSDWTPPTKVTHTVVELTDNQYHEIADEYMDMICAKFEELQDEREDVDVEFSAGVLSITFPNIGTYVVNKQPPNKQIWLSSPISGPKRFDYVVIGDTQQEKEGTSAYAWLCMRDKSALSEVFLKETGVDLTMPVSHYGE